MRIYEEEDQNIEFKESWNSTELLKWVCGFANAKGGKLYIGIRDDGEVIGLTNSKKLMEDIPNAIVTAFGMYDVEVNLKRVKDKKYIEIIVPRSKVVLDYKGISYIKIGTTLQIMKGESLIQSVVKRSSLSWDSYTVDGIGIEDLDEESFKIFKEEATKTKILSGINLEDRFTILNELELIEDGKLTRAAILLFHATPHKIFPGSYVQIGRFASEADILYQDEIKGSLMVIGKSIFKALDTNYKYNLISYDKTTRHETPPYPNIVIREAIYNALMHNDWSSCQPITIKVFDLKMEINNRSILPLDWTIENHNSTHINPLISNTFKYAGFVEKFGTGIPKMLNACQKEGNPKPEYRVFDKGILLRLKPSDKYMALVNSIYGENVADIGENTPNVGENTPNVGENTPNVGENTPNVGENTLNVADIKNNISTTGNVFTGANSRRKLITNLIKEKSTLSANEIALILNVSQRTIERDIDWLRENKIVKRKGSAKGGHWEILKAFDDKD